MCTFGLQMFLHTAAYPHRLVQPHSSMLRIPNNLVADGGICSWVMLSAKELPPKGTDCNCPRNISFRQKSKADLSCVL